MTIDCAYCGGTHPTVAGVRDCWGRSDGSVGARLGDAPGEDAPEDGDWFDEDEGPGGEVEAPRHPQPAQPARPVRPARPAGPRPVWRAGPAGLGRNLLVVGDGEIPEDWRAAEVITLDVPLGEAGDVLADRLVVAAHARVPLVFRTPSAPSPPAETEAREPWRLEPTFRFTGELVHHLATVNSVEIHPGSPPYFALAEAALRLGAGTGDGRSGDVVLGDGTPAFCDGGPIRALDGAALGAPGSVVLHRVALEHGSLVPFGGPEPTAELAPDQLRAVVHAGGSARIIAPAGSGKTRVLTERVRHLLRGWRVPPAAACLVAYNVRAAEEMRDRTADLAGLEIRTLNSLALAVVNGTRPFAATGSRRATIDESRVRDVLEKLVALPRRANTDPAAAWIEALSGVRLGLRDPGEVEGEYGGDVDGLGEVFDGYRTALSASSAVDFDEQVYLAVETLLRHPQARAAAHRACRLLLVDEFQDLTPAHVLLLRLVAGPDGAVFGVGDDDQTIYGYSGASPDWLIGFDGLFPGAEAYALEVNYRCPPAVVTAVDRLLQRNRRRIAKQMRPAPGRVAVGETAGDTEPGGLRILHASGASGAEGADGADRAGGSGTGAAGATVESNTVARVRDHLDGGSPPASVAVLARVNASLVPVQVALREQGIPTRSVLDDAWMRRTPVAAALAWLRIAAQPGRIAGPDLRVALRRPPRGIAPKVVDWAVEQGSLEALRRLAERLVGRDGPKVGGLADDIGLLSDRARSGEGADRLLAMVRDDLGLDRAMVSLEGARRRLDRSAQTDDLDALVALARIHPDLGTFEAWLRQRLREPSAADGVVLATVHSVKGREWPHVVVHQATAGVMPHRLASDREEERRVFHVAVTRGIETVTVSCGRPPSPFVAELFRDPAADPPDEAPRPVAVASRAGTARAGAGGPSTSRPGSARAAELLRDWRRKVASEEKRPAYTIFHDSTLDAIAADLPTTLGDLRAIKGIGPAKLDRYGDVILALVAEAAE